MINPAAPTHPISAKQHSAAHQPSASTLDWTGRRRFNGSNQRRQVTSNLVAVAFRPSAAFELLDRPTGAISNKPTGRMVELLSLKSAYTIEAVAINLTIVISEDNNSWLRAGNLCPCSEHTTCSITVQFST